MSLKWTGLDELHRELRALPAALATDATVIAVDAAHTALRDAAAHYPGSGSGELRNGLEVEVDASGGSAFASVILRNTTWYARIFEEGTAARHSRFGNRGSMPPGHVFYPAVGRAKRVMYRRLADMVRAHGLTVKGAA